MDEQEQSRSASAPKAEIRKTVNQLLEARTQEERIALLAELEKHSPHTFPRNILLRLKKYVRKFNLFRAMQGIFGQQLTQQGQGSLVPEVEQDYIRRTVPEIKELLDKWEDGSYRE